MVRGKLVSVSEFCPTEERTLCISYFQTNKTNMYTVTYSYGVAGIFVILKTMYRNPSIRIKWNFSTRCRLLNSLFLLSPFRGADLILLRNLLSVYSQGKVGNYISGNIECNSEFLKLLKERKLRIPGTKGRAVSLTSLMCMIKTHLVHLSNCTIYNYELVYIKVLFLHVIDCLSSYFSLPLIPSINSSDKSRTVTESVKCNTLFSWSSFLHLINICLFQSLIKPYG